MCFAEEVILADDENENDYDGNKSLLNVNENMKYMSTYKIQTYNDYICRC